MEDSMISNFNNSGGANIQQSSGSSMGSGMADGELNVTGSQSTSNQKQTVQYTIPGILCFIQNEWTKFEMERSQWEIDKAELQAKIAFLQGERRGQENLKSDLIRRIKMLEYTLKQERDKYYKLKNGIDLKQGDMRSPFDDQHEQVSQAENTTLTTESVATTVEADKNLNVTVIDTSNQQLLQQQEQPQQQSQPQPQTNNNNVNDGNGIGNDLDCINSAWRQSHQILRQYLHEIGYTDTILHLRSNKLKNLLGCNYNNETEMSNSINKVKDLSNCDTIWRRKLNSDKESEKFYPFLTNSNLLLKDTNDENETVILNQNDSLSNFKDDDDVDAQAQEVYDELNSLTISEKMSVKDCHQKNEMKWDADMMSSAARMVFQNDQNNELVLGELAGLTVSNDSDNGQDVPKAWNAKYTLRNHFDCVRALAFDLTQPMLVTASDDCTLKLWNLQKSVSTKKLTSLDIEPIFTFRNHTSPVLCLALDNDESDCNESLDRKLFSADLNGNLLCWNLPNFNIDAYGSYQSNMLDSKLVGHTDAIHSLIYYQSLLLSCSADKSVKLWSPKTSKQTNSDPLKLSLMHSNELLTPTSVDFLRLESFQTATGYDNGSVSVHDCETGKAVLNLESVFDKSIAGASESYIYRLVAHPTLSLIITAHEDRNIRYWDYNSGTLIHSMVAHLDAVTCLSLDPNGMFLLSGSHDCSIRLWNLKNKTCVQEITVHRKKFDESILDVAFHPTRQFIASAGADGLAKVFIQFDGFSSRSYPNSNPSYENSLKVE